MKTILIVDDEPEIVDLLWMVLESDELHLLAAYDGEEALAIVDEQHPQLVLSDVMMPQLDGQELCKQIRCNPATRETVVILMSAARNVDPAEANEVVLKPFDLQGLAKTVRDYLTDSPEKNETRE